MRKFIVGFVCSLAFFLSGCGGRSSQIPVPTPTPSITVTITPSARNLMSGEPAVFSATVGGTADQRITWSVEEANGGSIDSSGNYTASSANGVFHVKATSTAAAEAFATATVTVGSPVPPAEEMWSVWGSGPSDVWASGVGVMYHWDGIQWHSTFMQSRFGSFVDDIWAVWGSGPNDVWNTGTSVSIEFKHWEGSTWNDFPPNLASFAFGMWGSGPNDVWGFGTIDAATVFHWDGNTWTFDSLQPSSGQAYWLQNGWGSSANDVWTVGAGDETGQGLAAATVFHWDGNSWKQVLTGLNSPLLGVWGSSATDVWSVGENGLIAHWDGTAWTAVPSGTTQMLWNVWGAAANDVWAVGNAGTVLHWDGRVWAPVAVSTTKNLHGIWGSGPKDIWAVGDQTILHLL